MKTGRGRDGKQMSDDGNEKELNNGNETKSGRDF